MKSISKRLILAKDRMLLSALLKAMNRYMNHQHKIKKYINPKSQWSGVNNTEDTLMLQVKRALERRLG
jgi:hypothetical protein|tara:strand:- start:230 stop:433 length:204 start_codon:yes stop_codon:yes gene_type:complete